VSASPTIASTAEPPESPVRSNVAPRKKSREVRLGIVMYGGISLAIYIYGVAYELFRAVRGRGVYKLIKAITDSDIVVDIASGTSAGGINGILLSYALCNERDLGAAAVLWREDGDLDRMLRRPEAPDLTCQSVLDSEGYYQARLQRAFADMPALSPEPGEDPSAVGELDLFVTSTDVDGSVMTRFDDAGRPIDVKDHRAVFILKHRPGRLEPFIPDVGASGDLPGPRIAALAKLARMTSCFPVAFAPVLVRRDTDDLSDQALCTWGALRRDTCFLDGGLLDNKPFTYTLGAIFNRLADREVGRVLFYVEPDPERFAQPEKPTQPNVVQAALDALVTIPGYESIADDLRLLNRHNDRVEQYARLVSDLGSEPPEPSLQTANLHRRSRLVALTDRVVDGLLKCAGRDTLMTEDQKRAAAGLIKAFDEEVTGPVVRALTRGGEARDGMLVAKAARFADDLIDDFDVYFRQRRLFRVTYLIYDLLSSARKVSADVASRYREILRAMNRQIKLYEILQWAMEGLIDSGVFRLDDARAAWVQVQSALGHLVDEGSAVGALIPEHFTGEDGWLPQGRLTRVRNALVGLSLTIETEIRAGHLPAGEPGPSLLRRADRLEAEMLTSLSPDDPVRAAHASFLALDAVLYPLELMSGLHEKDAIRIVRISPLDATTGFSKRNLADKVAGDAAYHFGGFLKRSWRSNDILWGRLDGACKLLETLLAADPARGLGGRLRRVAEDDGLRPQILRRLQSEPALDPETLFPRSGARVHAELRDWLLAVFDPDPSRRAAALADAMLAERTALLVEATQLEILGEDVPKVIDDAIAGQAAWNAYKVPLPGSTPSWDPKSWTFRPSGRETDPQVTLTGAAKIAAEEMRTLGPAPGQPAATPSATPLGRFFSESYRVGAESMDDIPPLVLLQTVLGALMVLRRCLVNAFGPRARSGVAGQSLRIVGVCLSSAHALTVLGRRAPTWGIAASLAVAAVCTTLVVVGLWKASPLLQGRGWVAFLVGPVLVLAVEILLLRWIGRRYARVGG
jgi:patatin-related protein